MSQARLVLIAAMAKNRTIGINNTLPWRLPEDLQHFKALTVGRPIVMGRKTWESLGRPLPGRAHFVVSRDENYRHEAIQVFTSLPDAIRAAKEAASKAGVEEIFVIGGADIYGQALLLADRLELTEINQEFAGDAFFPAISAQDWKEVSRENHLSANGLGYDFVRWERQPPL